MFPHCGPSCPVTVERNTEISAEQQWRRRNYCFKQIQFSNHHDVGVKTQQRHFFLLDITKNWSSGIKHRRNHWTNRRSMKMLQVMLSTLQFNSLLLCRGRRVTAYLPVLLFVIVMTAEAVQARRLVTASSNTAAGLWVDSSSFSVCDILITITQHCAKPPQCELKANATGRSLNQKPP